MMLDEICEHCSFGNEHVIPFERDRWRTNIDYKISDIYQKEAEKI